MLVEDLIKRFELFQDMDDVGLRKVLQFGRFKYFPKDSIIYRQGEMGAGLLCVLEGRIELYHEQAAANSEDQDASNSVQPSSAEVVDHVGSEIGRAHV